MLFGKHVNRFYLKYCLFFLLGVAALVVVDVFQLYIPEYLGEIVDILNEGAIAENMERINDIIVMTVIIAFIMFGGRVIWRLSLFHASTKIEADLRHKMFLKAERLSQTYYHENKVGNIISWFTTDLEAIEEIYGWGSISLVDAIFLSVFVIIKMFLLDWLVTIVALIPIALIFVWGFMVEKFMSMKWENRQKALDEVYDFSQENFTGIRVIKAFVKETQQLHAFAKIAKKNQDVNVDFVRYSVLFDICITIICAVIVCIILGLGGFLVFQTIEGSPLIIGDYKIEFSNGDLITFIGYFDTLVWPVIAFGQIFVMRSRAKASLKRVSRFLDQEEDIKNPDNPVTLKDVKGEIRFNDFTFSYPNQKTPALKNISLTIKPGESVGVVGKIGSGKSTLMNALLRLYNIEKGMIYIDGVDMMDADITSLREAIGFVPQDNYLYSDTIEKNIAFANPKMQLSLVEEGAKFADVHSNIVDFPSGYQTITGERGVSLSGGQKQRISIARAFVKKSPIMIMDDSVSAVDIKTEETILDNIKRERKGLTTILIASRVSTVMHLDKIIVMNEGTVEGFDTHENLLKSCPTYKKMVFLQELEKEIGGDDGE